MLEQVGKTTSSRTLKENNQQKVAKSAGDFSQLLGKVQTNKSQQKSANLDEIFAKAASTYQVPVELLKAVGKAESGFQADAISHCGAEGIMQLMPKTAASLGVTNSLDPAQNIMGGAKYLSQKLAMYDGDIKLTLAAYNAGSGNVKEYGGIPPFKETRNYVEKVLGYLKENITAGSVTETAGTKAAATKVGNGATFVDSAGATTNSNLQSLSAAIMMLKHQMLLSSLSSRDEKQANESLLASILPDLQYTETDYSLLLELAAAGKV